MFGNEDDYRLNVKSRLMTDYVYLLDKGVWLVLLGNNWTPVVSVLKKDGSSSNKSGCRLDKLKPECLIYSISTRCGDNLKNQEATMANTCFIKILAVYGDSTQAKNLTERLNLLALEAAKQNEGFGAGDHLYIFDGEAASSHNAWNWKAG